MIEIKLDLRYRRWPRLCKMAMWYKWRERKKQIDKRLISIYVQIGLLFENSIA